MDNKGTEQKKYTGINRLLRINSVQKIVNRLGDGTFKTFYDDWKWIFSFSKRYKWIVVFYTAMGIVSSTLSLGASWVSKLLINIIVGKKFESIWFLAIAMVFSTVFSLITSSILNRVGTKISIHVNNDIQAEVFDKIVDADWRELNRFQNGDLLNRFSKDTCSVANNAINWLPNLIISLYTFAATFILLFKTDPNMAWIAIISAPFLLLMSRFIMRRMREYKRRVLELDSDMMSFEVESFYNLDMIKSFGAANRTANRLRWWQRRYRDTNLDYNKFEIKSNIAMSLMSAVVSMIAFSYCLWRLWTNKIQYGDMTFFLTQRGQLSAQFNSLIAMIPGMISSALSAHRIRELVDLPKESHDLQSLERIAASAQEGLTVEMSGVGFEYDEGKPVYENGSFVARPGEIVAVLSPSGGGKTTMLRLMLGLIHPSEGSVTLSDTTGESVDMNADLRCLFSYVPQGNSIMAGTIADNLRLVKEDATDDEIIEALRLSCAWDFISQRPDGIYSRVGERGEGLSEGQSQRVAIARAILRDAPILLLDEATSALDTETEKRVLENIIRNDPRKTCIVSTHRRTVLRQCHRVYYIKDRHTKLLPPDNVEELAKTED